MPTVIGTPTALNIGQTASPGAQSITVPANAQFVVVFYGCYDGGDPELSVSSTFASLTVVEQLNAGSGTTGVAYGYVTATGSQTITPSWGTSLAQGPSFIVAFFEGVHPSLPVHATTVRAESGAFSDTVASTLGTLVLALETAAVAAAPGTPAGWTSLQTQVVASSIDCAARLSRADAPGTPTTALATQAANYPRIAAIALSPAPAGISFVPGIDSDNKLVLTPSVVESAGAADAGAIPRLAADGKLDPSTYEAGGLTGFSSSINTASPNATVPVHQIAADGAQTNIDLALTPKGTGALSAHVADGTTAGGNKRGTNAVDWQRSRATAARVASGQTSTISGGINNTASGSTSTVSGGNNNTASGSESTVSGGSGNTASGLASTVSGGSGNSASGFAAAISGGANNTASAGLSWIPGGEGASTRGIAGASAWSSARRVSNGDNQHFGMVVQRETTDSTPTILTANRGAPSTSNVLVLPNNSVWFGQVWVGARDTSGNIAHWLISVSGKRGANAASTVVTRAQVVDTFAEAALSTASVAIVANTTRGSIEIEVTGIAATTIDWFGEMFGGQIVR